MFDLQSGTIVWSYAMLPDDALRIYHCGPEIVVKTLCELSASIDSLENKIKMLENKVAKLSKNSSNSSKRPSSDDITKPKSKKKGNHKIGGQPGHLKNERALFTKEEINTFHSYILAVCPDCNGEVTILDAKPRILQQIELIEVPLMKEEHRSYPDGVKNVVRSIICLFRLRFIKKGCLKNG